MAPAACQGQNAPTVTPFANRAVRSLGPTGCGRAPAICHSERSEESLQLKLQRTAEILRRPNQIGAPQDDSEMGVSAA